MSDTEKSKPLLLHPDADALDTINKMTGASYTAEDLYVCRLRVVESELDRLFDKPTPEFVEQFSEIAVGLRATFDHDLENADKQWGVIYSTEVKTDEEGNTYCECWAFFPIKANSEQFIERMRSGIYHNLSPSYRAKRRCSICGEEVISAYPTCSNNHVPGQTYDGRLCYSELTECLEVLEVSIVTCGCQRHTAIINKKLNGGKMTMGIPTKRERAKSKFMSFIRKSLSEEEAANAELQFAEVLAATDEPATEDIVEENEELRGTVVELEAKLASCNEKIAELEAKLQNNDDEKRAAEEAAEQAADEAAVEKAIDDAIEEACGTDDVIKKHFIRDIDRSKLSYDRASKEVKGLSEQLDIVKKSYTELYESILATSSNSVGLPKASGNKNTHGKTTMNTVNSDSWD